MTTGWIGETETELNYLRGQAKKHSKILEIGSWHGKSTRALAESTLGVVYAVDTWNGSKEEKHVYDSSKLNLGDNAFMEFCRVNGDMIDKGKIIPIRMHSANANWVFDTLGVKFDMIFIDGDHTYNGVKSDIIGTRTLLAPGGLLCGHDYTNWPGVKQAVDELVPKFAVNPSIWHVGDR